MKLIINETEVRTAVCEWLKQQPEYAGMSHALEVNDLKPLMKTEGLYDDAETFQIGYEVDLAELKT